jgi:hypothetical protein
MKYLGATRALVGDSIEGDVRKLVLMDLWDELFPDSNPLSRRSHGLAHPHLH